MDDAAALCLRRSADRQLLLPASGRWSTQEICACMHMFCSSGNGVSRKTICIILYLIFYQVSKRSADMQHFVMLSAGMIVLGLAMVQSNLYVFFNWPWIGRGMVSFFTGCVLAAALSYQKISRKVWNMIFGSLLLSYFLFRRCLWVSIDNNGWLEACAVTVVLFPALIYFSIRVKSLRELLASRGMELIGRISFSLFLVHYPVQLILVTVNEYFFMGWNYGTVRFLLLYMGAALTAAVLLYHWVERPVSGKIRAFYYKNAENL